MTLKLLGKKERVFKLLEVWLFSLHVSTRLKTLPFHWVGGTAIVWEPALNVQVHGCFPKVRQEKYEYRGNIQKFTNNVGLLFKKYESICSK